MKGFAWRLPKMQNGAENFLAPSNSRNRSAEKISTDLIPKIF